MVRTPRFELSATISNEKFKEETVLILATPLPSVQHTSSYRLRTAQISRGNSKLEPISQIRLIEAFIRKRNRDVLGPLPATHSKHTTHLSVLTSDSPS